MDDIYEYLKLDHIKVAKLFDLYATATSQRNKLEIVAMLNKEISAHSVSEEKTFYQALEHYRKGKKEVLHGKKEHEEIKNMLAEIVNLNQVNKTLDNKVLELKKMVEHHVSDEEGKIFSEAKDVLSKDEALILKEKMHDLKGKILLAEFPD